MKHCKLLLYLSVLTLAACAEAPQVARSTLGAAPVLDGGGYSSGGGITVAAEIKPMGGATALCGVWAESDSKRQSVLSKGKAGEVVASGSAYVDGQVIHRGLYFMRKVSPSDGFAGQSANCVITARPWQTGDEAKPVVIRIPRQVVYRDDGEMGSGGVQVVFRQTGPGA